MLPPQALHPPGQVAWLSVRPGRLPPEHGTSDEATAKPDTVQQAAKPPRPLSWTTSVRGALPDGRRDTEREERWKRGEKEGAFIPGPSAGRGSWQASPLQLHEPTQQGQHTLTLAGA